MKNRRKNEVITVLVLLVVFFLSACIIQQQSIKELESKEVNPYIGHKFATIQYVDDMTGKLITVQGDLDFDMGLQPPEEWNYEINGIEGVITGARVIGENQLDNRGKYTQIYIPSSHNGEITVVTPDGTLFEYAGKFFIENRTNSEGNVIDGQYKITFPENRTYLNSGN